MNILLQNVLFVILKSKGKRDHFNQQDNSEITEFKGNKHCFKSLLKYDDTLKIL